MKKILSLLLCGLVLVSMLALVGCTKDDEANTVKFGAGVYSTVKATDVTEDNAGSGAVDASIAAVLVDADGKIVACELDTLSMSTGFAADGKVTPVADKDLKSKYEQGAEYGMKSDYGSKREWTEHVDILEKQIIGKTIDEVKALVVNNYKGNDDVQAAGCTIGINDLILAVEKAVANANAEVAADAKLKVVAVGQQAVTELSEDTNAGNELTGNLFAAAVDGDGKVLAAHSDCVVGAFTLKDGKVTADNEDGLSKRNKGAGYGMKGEYGSEREWFEHADAFDAQCVGKTGAEIAKLIADDGHGVEDVQKAGCTIYVYGFVAAASKI